MNHLIGTHLGPYQLLAPIRRGGMAAIYKAYQPALERYVAVKVLFHGRDAQFAARFRREARDVAQLQHPNILPIYDYGEQGGLLYLAMQYVENGVTLGDLPGLPPAQVVRVITQVLSALAYVHTRGIVHRDIKPSNILMAAESWPVLIDFGIAKHADDRLNLTVEGAAIGTPAYMAPEQASGSAVDARTDLYALGVVLYELLTGRPPFEADTPLLVLMQHVYQPPPPPHSLNPDLPAELEAVLLRALAKDPAERYQSAVEMAAALEYAAHAIEQTRRTAPIAEIAVCGRCGHQLSTRGQCVLCDSLSATPAPAVHPVLPQRPGAPTEGRASSRAMGAEGTQAAGLASSRAMGAEGTQAASEEFPPRRASATRRHGRLAAWSATLMTAAVLLGGGQHVAAEQSRATPTSTLRPPSAMAVSPTAMPTSEPLPTATPTHTAAPTTAPTDTATATLIALTPTEAPTATATGLPRRPPTARPRPKPAVLPPTDTPAPPPPTDTAVPAPPDMPTPADQPPGETHDSDPTRQKPPKPTGPPKPPDPTTPPKRSDPTTPPKP